MRNSTLPVLLVALLATPLRAQSFSAQVSVNSNINATTSYTPQDGKVLSDGATTLAGGVSKTVGVDANNQAFNNALWAYGSSNATASAGAGLLRVYSAMTGNAQGLFAGSGAAGVSAGASSTAMFDDYASFFLTGVPSGTTVTIKAMISASGLISVGGSPDATGKATLNWGATFGSSTFAPASFSTDQNGVGLPFTGGAFFVSSTVTIGAATKIAMSAAATVTGGAGLYCNPCRTQTSSSIAAQSDFSHTFEWKGITEVRLADGTLVDLSRLSATSSSGFNYINAPSTTVPEPSSIALLAVGLTGLAATSRARRRATNRTT